MRQYLQIANSVKNLHKKQNVRLNVILMTSACRRYVVGKQCAYDVVGKTSMWCEVASPGNSFDPHIFIRSSVQLVYKLNMSCIIPPNS